MKRKSKILLEMVEEIFATDEESFKEVMAYESLEELCDACFEKPYEAVAASLRGNLSYGTELELLKLLRNYAMNFCRRLTKVQCLL